MSSLFLDLEHKLTFQKIAMPVKLSDAPEAWQREIAGEIFKQVPFLSDYAVNIVIDRVDAERGFAFGSVKVTNKSQAPMQEQQELPSIRIPIIVRERLLLPLDVFMDGEGVYPLTASRVREHLFRTATFETSTRKPTDQGMVDQLYPPMRSNYGMGAVQGDALGIGKYANHPAEMARRQAVAMTKADAARYPAEYVGKYSCGDKAKMASLVEEIAPTIPEADADEFVSQIAQDKALSVAAAKNQVFAKLAMTIAAAPKSSVEKTAEALVQSIKPTVVQLEKLASGDFKVKWANAGAFAPQEGVVDPAQAQAMAGADLSGMQPGGTVTVGTVKAKKDLLKEEGFEQADEPGTYRVMNADTNEETVGYVMPVTDFEQHPLELHVFVGEAGYACQDEIAGIRQEGGAPPQAMPIDQANGDGVFVYDVSGKFHCLPPMTIHTTATSPDGTLHLQGETVLGEQLDLAVGPGLQAIQQLGDGEYAIPDFLQWVPLQGEAMHLVKKPEEIGQTQAAQAAPSTVEVGSTGAGEFHMDGQPLAKVAKTDKRFLKRAQAEFLLVGMGMNPFQARELLKEAEAKGKVKVAGLQSIVPLADVHREMVKKAADTLSNFPYELRRNLIKEAAALEDADTADKILAMNFLNPENVSTFAAHLPQLDETSSKLAEMLVASRLGMNQVDEGAVERAMKNLEQVIEGLKALQQKQMV